MASSQVSVVIAAFNTRLANADAYSMPEVEGVRLVADAHKFQRVDLEQLPLDPGAAALLPEAVARRHHVVPIGRKFGAPVVALSDPGDVLAFDTLRASLGREFVAVVADPDQISVVLDRLYAVRDMPSAAPSGPAAGLASPAPSAATPPASAPAADEVPAHELNTPPSAASTGDEHDPLSDALAEAVPDSDRGPTAETGTTSNFPPLARVLVEGERVSLAAMREVLEERDRTGQAIARILTARGLVTEADLMWGMAQEMGLEFVDLDVRTVDF